MEVTCDRCGTEYEFDDALVSERGTTVQCTNCGLQFRVRRQTGNGPEVWLVRSTGGDEHAFNALRELQAAIANGVVTREDVLERSGSRPRRLGSIAELEPFFVKQQPVRITKTLPPPSAGLYGAVQYDVSVAVPLPRPPPAELLGETPPPPDSLADTALLPPKAARPDLPPPKIPPPSPFGPTQVVTPNPLVTPLPPPPAPPPPTHVQPVRSIGPADDDQVTTAERPKAVPDPAPLSPNGSPLSPNGAPAEVPRAAVPRDAGAMVPSIPIPTPTPPEIRLGSSMDDAFEPRFTSPYSSRKGGGGSLRWVVGTIMVGALLFAAVVFGRRYLTTAAPAAGDPRVAQFVEGGEKAIAEGDLEAAKEQLDKASALAEKDPKVAASLARLSVLRSEIPWLKARIVQGKADVDAAQRELEAAGTRTRKAADLAFALSADDPAVLRCRVDSLRIANDLEAAKSLVGRLTNPDEPETAITLSALDLAAGKPKDPQTVVKRLRAAVASEGQLGRARALLVYALVLAGDNAAAKAEADKLAGGTHPHPLAALLKAYADQGGAIDPATLPDANEPPVDAKTSLAEAKKAFDKGEVGRAENLYLAILKKQPDNLDATLGMGQVFLKKNDRTNAQKMFEQALKKDAKSLPAMAALADMKWDQGDKAGAGVLYKQIAAAGASPFEDRAKERAKQAPPQPGGKHEKSGGDDGRVPDDYVWTPPGDDKKPEHKPEPKPEPPQ